MMASGTCAKCHGDGCQGCWGSGWCPACGGCGMICSFCKSPTVRVSGSCSGCDACHRISGPCDGCIKAQRIECASCAAGDVEEEALRIAAKAPTPEFSDDFYRELTDAIETAGNQLPRDDLTNQ